MPIEKLTDAAIRKLKLDKANRYADGAGLWLQVSRWGSKSWIFQYTLNGKRRQHGLGPYPVVTLADAREKAAELRRLVREGTDPISHKAAGENRKRKFSDVANEHVKNQMPVWRNTKHAAQWTSTLRQYVFPYIGDIAVSAITKDDVKRVLDLPEQIDRT